MATEQSRNHRYIWLALILALAVGLRLLALYLIGDSRVPWIIEFEEIANNLIQTGQYSFSFYKLTPPLPTSFLPPIYPLLLALSTYLWSTSGDLAVRIIQIFLSCSSIIGLFFLTRSLGGTDLQGLLAALAWAIYPPSVSYAVDLSTVTVETFFVIFGIWLVVKTANTHSPLTAILAGVFLAMAALTRPTWLIMIPLVLVWLLWYFHKITSKYISLLALIAISSIFVLSPWIIYNYKTHGVLMVSSTNGGLNFWIGNNPKATGEYIFPTVLNRELVLSTTHLTEVDRDHFFYAQGIKFIQEHPKEYIQLVGRKLLYFFFFRPGIGSSYEAANYHMFDLIRWLFVASWLVLLPFAIWGIFTLGKTWRLHSLLFVIFTSQALISALYFSGTRFRTPLDGLVIIWAIFGLSSMLNWTKQRNKSLV